MRKCEYIDRYMAAVESGEIPASTELKQAMPYIGGKLKDPDVFIDTEKIDKAVELIERYFPLRLLDWELFVLALVHCYYQSNDTPVFSEFLIVMGRGNGKNGFISALAWYLTTKYHGIAEYNVDIIANSEDQAKTSFEDVFLMLERTWEKSKYFFTKTKEIIRNRNTGSYIRYNTSNARTKDGKRSACLIFDEIHEYENSDTIKVFRSGFGKRKHSRIFYITTNGYVRDGVLDDKLALARDVLKGAVSGSRLCPLIYKMDSEDEVEHPELWVKANPSLPSMPLLKLEMDQEYIDMRYDKSVELDFFTKRMNLPKSDMEIAVTDWENIKATNRPLPDLTGWPCVVGIDYASLSDWASVVFHFRRGEQRYDLVHTWVCARSVDLPRIKAPWREWEEKERLTVVDREEIPASLLTDYIAKLGKRYGIQKIAMDNFRYALMRRALESIGYYGGKDGSLYLVRPSDIMKTVPVITSCFVNRYYSWGDAPELRWAANNTKLVRSGRREGADTGNFYYAKIEAKSRKNDPFMALAAAMAVEGELGDGIPAALPDLGVLKF